MTLLDTILFRRRELEGALGAGSPHLWKKNECRSLVQTMLDGLADALNISHIRVFSRCGSDFVFAGFQGTHPVDVRLRLAGDSAIIHNLCRTHRPTALCGKQVGEDCLQAPPAERTIFESLGAKLLLALPGRNRLMGVMAVGPKRSACPYSEGDLQVLQAMGSQAGMALELCELADSLANERGRTELADQEMEVAREAQQRLYPQEMPSLKAGTIAGMCCPAHRIGGDYYDVFSLAEGRIALAIGDVSGKGTSAALLMAGLRAAVRGAAIDHHQDLSRLLERVNHLVYESSAETRYVTFFFGAFDPATYVLEYVNAGHNAPLVLRSGPGRHPEILRLEGGGLVLGLFREASYGKHRVQLQAGDLLLAYTDGIVESTSSEGMEWGEERMMRAAWGAESAEDAIEKIDSALSQFAAHGAQQDDMALLVLKLKADRDAAA